MPQTALKLATLADRARLLGLLTKGFPTHSAPQWERRFEAWWKKNPALSPEADIGWVLESEAGAVLGFMGSIPVRFLIHGARGIAAAASSWYVEPGYRGVSSLSFLQAFLRQRTPDLFLSTTPTDKVQKIQQQLGFTSLEFPHGRREYWLVLKPKETLRHLLAKNTPGQRGKRLLLVLGLPAMRLVWRAAYYPKNKKLAAFRSSRFRCSVVHSCDDSFTALWEKTKGRYSTTLWRDAETLNWLLTSRGSEDSRFLIRGDEDSGQGLAGYLMFDIDRVAGSASPMMHLKDVYLPEFKEEALLAMVAEAIRLGQEKGVALIKFWAADPETQGVFRRFLPLQKKCTYSYLYKYAKTANQIQRSAPPVFFPSLLDPDRGLI